MAMETKEIRQRSNICHYEAQLLSHFYRNASLYCHVGKGMHAVNRPCCCYVYDLKCVITLDF